MHHQVARTAPNDKPPTNEQGGPRAAPRNAVRMEAGSVAFQHPLVVLGLEAALVQALLLGQALEETA